MMGTVVNFRRGDTCPEDLIFAAPGASARDAQQLDHEPLGAWRCEPITTGGGGIWWAIGSGIIFAAFVAGFICGELAAVAQIVGLV